MAVPTPCTYLTQKVRVLYSHNCTEVPLLCQVPQVAFKKTSSLDTDVYTGKHISISVDLCLMAHKKRKHHQTEAQRKQERETEDKAEKKGDIKGKDENKNNK